MNGTFLVVPAENSDVPDMARIWASSFETDRHTVMKNAGKKPYDMEAMGISVIPSWIASDEKIVVKAVESATGRTVGWCCWGFRGFKPANVELLSTEREKNAMDATASVGDDTMEEPQGDSLDPDPIRRLEAMTDADMQRWMKKLMPPGTKCMYIVTLTVVKEFWSRSVGSALLRYGTDIADRVGVFCWVHSSDSAWKVYAKSGFEVVGELDVDLDAYAPGPPPAMDGSGESLWGHYVFRYMKRLPAVKQPLETIG
ncbi:hypothetical protein BJ742DRAFT_134519 [Cladochytrium replicatum]|nr:hypothetical protein BJ742DRAFT_134519 [Cladochytrium replicatum]